MSESANKAVFLSYASQDAEAAKRICEALRAIGVEVWFDQSELRGGDAWDQKIRRQIKECALFVPVISQHTRERLEGYFRREWRVAVDRMHDMDDDMPFLVPVVVDDTTDANARVPERFRERQWTRLPGGETPAAFCQRVRKLLGGIEMEAGRPRPPTTVDSEITGRGTRATRKLWILPALVGLAAIAAVVVWQRWRKTEKSALAAPAAPVTQPAEQLSPARQLVERARVITLPGSLTRAQLDTAEELCARAMALDPSDGVVWTEAARVDLLKVYPYGYDRSEERRKQAMSRAARAITLSPDSFDARVVQAAVFAHAGGSPALVKEAEKTFRELIVSHPDDQELKIQLAEALREQHRFDEAARQFEALGEYEVAGWSYYQGGDARAALVAVTRGLSAKRSVTALQLKAIVQTDTTEDLDAVQATLDQLRPSELLSEMPAAIAMKVALYRRDPERLLQIAQGLTQDYLDSNAFRGPRQYFTGLAHELAGRSAAAAGEWRAGIAVVQTRLQSAPDDRELVLWLAWLHAALKDSSEAERLLARAQTLAGLPIDQPDPSNVKVFWRLGRNDSALAALSAKLRSRPTNWEEIHAEMRYSPIYDGVRADPRFERLLRENLPEGAKPFGESKNSDHGTQTVTAPAVDQKSIAVLAFANLSDDKGNEYFSDGISEELLNVLAKVPGLKVTARTSAFFFKGRNVPIAEIARQLGVAYVVEGSVRKQGEKVRISAQLIKAADGFNVWSDKFDRGLKDIFAVQDEIAGLIAEQMQLKLGVTHSARAVDPEAHRLLLEARYYWYQRGEQNFDRTETLLNRALAIDPDFAPAHAAMADLWVMRAAYRVTEGAGDLSEELRSLRTSAARATQLDPSLVAPIAAMAYGLLIEGRMEAAQQHFEAAVALSPNDPTVRFWRALFLTENGDFDAARREFVRARELDPKAWIIAHLSGQNALQLGRTEEALALFRQANADRPDGFAPAVGYESLALWQSGRTDEAVAAARAVRQSWPRQPRWQADAHAIWVLRQAGLTTEAAAYADAVFAGLPAQTYQRGFLLAALGRFDEALPYLERTSILTLDAIGSLVMFDPWRDDPRFTALIEKLHWTEQYAKARAAMKPSAAATKP